ncbi:MAG: hypothetical protein JNK85_00005 [Verrucomicrobiales bacterium]|nr:hypothetical protein [Verrucomicrobiales bacterium]
MPLGDSITRGSYIAKRADGSSIGLPHPDGGGWRVILQEKLRAAGIAFDFVGPLDNLASDAPGFDPDHAGFAGFSNAKILSGGEVPTTADVLRARGVDRIIAPSVTNLLRDHRPAVVLLMSGANGFDAPARDRLMRTIVETSDCLLLVATIPPQKAPREGWERVERYNASLPRTVEVLRSEGKRVRMVDVHAAMTPDDLLSDGVHPNRDGMRKIAEAWFAVLVKPN